MDNLQNIIKRIKSICQEENLKVNDNVILEIASKLYISENIDKSKKENIKTMSNYQNDILSHPKGWSI